MEEVKSTKLVINIKEGIIQAEGDEAFVREVYNDFKEVVSKKAVTASTPAALEHIREPTSEKDSQGSTATSPRGKAKRIASSNKGGGDTVFKPKFDTDLDLTGIEEFYAKFSPVNNSEKILVFTAFLRDHLSKATCTAHEIYTCYFITKEKIPAAFVQAFRDCQSRTHYIKYTTLNDIEVAIPGNNWLNAQTKKKAASE